MKRSDRFLYFYLPWHHRLFYHGKPVVLVNSFQKSGTHMLTEALATSLPLKYNARGIYNHALTRQWPSELQYKNTSAQQVIHFLEKKAWPGELLRGHIEYDNELAEYLKKAHIPHILLVRKPLDVLLSLANWWERHQDVPVVPFTLFKSIKDPEERLFFLLTGKDGDAQIWPDLVSRYKPFMSWLNDGDTLVIKYEEVTQNPQNVADKISGYMPIQFSPKNFLKGLKNTNNATFTKPESRVHQLISDSLTAAYYKLGGQWLEDKLGYDNA